MYKNKKETCQALPPHFERLNYYFGKMMTVRDFKAEQSYLNEKRWLLNRLGLGWGTLCGLKVVPCGGSEIAIEPGFALDPYGNEIMVADLHIVDLAKKEIVNCDESEIKSPPEPDCLYIYIKYVECFAEPAPVAVEECGKTQTECEYGRIREKYDVIVSRKKPDVKHEFESDLKDLLSCDYDCIRFLKDPCYAIIDGCVKREKCLGVPLARVCYVQNEAITEKDIDNCSYRQIAFSNNILYELIGCLHNEVSKFYAAKHDRKQYVPLLTQTIKGLSFRNGKILCADDFGINPIRLTSDGNFIWVTDSEEKKIRKFDTRERDHISFDEIELDFKGWGIAFDGHRMWVTGQVGQKDESGKLVGFNICDPTDKVEITGLKEKPREIVFDGRFLWITHDFKDEQGANEIHYLSKIDVTDCILLGTFPLAIPKEEVDSSIKGIAYDGSLLWAILDAKNDEGLRKIKITGSEPSIGEGIETLGSKQEDIVFDGTHIWVTHEGGAVKIDINTCKVIGRALKGRDQTAVAFDGDNIWTAEPKQGRINKVYLFLAEREEGYQEIGEDKDSYQISKICFDGNYLWIAASEEKGGSRRGLIHRLLP